MNANLENQILKIGKTARIRDNATGTYSEVIEFTVSGSATGRLALAPSVVNDPRAFEKHLRDAGAILPKDKQKLNALLLSIAQAEAKEFEYAAHTGWIENGNAFVTVDGLIGEASVSTIGINRSTEINELSGKLSANGTSKSWREGVGELAHLSSVMMFAICVAFAAPLLAIVKRHSFAICLFARTRAGKSIATLMAASVAGIGRMEDLITWNLTDARFEQRLAEYNDTVLPIDDLMGMAGKDKEKYLRIRELAYKLAQGWATGRHDSFTKAHGGAHEHWNCIVLTSYERSIRDLALAVRLERQHGEALRLIDVPACVDGLDHIFDRIPDDIVKGDFLDWKLATFKRIADACADNHGKVFRRYIGKLIAGRSDVEEYVRARTAFFVKLACDDFDGDVARDVAEKFGLIYAGGRLGIRYGLLPWDKDDLLHAITKCYLGARELLPDDGVTLRRGTELLRARLDQLPTVPKRSKKTVAKTKFNELDGYRERLETATRYKIRREVFNSTFTSGTQQQLVIAWLIQKKCITLAVPKTSEGARIAEPKGQFIWLDGERRRSFEIVWPRKRKSTNARSKARPR